jgi:hypothetical protein
VRLTMMLLVGAFMSAGCGGGSGGEADAGAKCGAMVSTWREAMGGVDNTCGAASDCIIPEDCRCGDPSTYSALGASLHRPVNKSAYQRSVAYGLTGQYVGECLNAGPHIADCGERQLACVDGKCAIASRENCMPPPPAADAGP